MKFSLAVLITLTLVTVTAVGQNLTPIVDLNSPVDAAANAPASLSMDAPDRAVDGQGDRYYQMQVLQEEVQMLRGMVEELNYELQQLKQRQMDDYLDIDRRLSAQVSGSAVSGATSASGVPAAPAARSFGGEPVMPPSDGSADGMVNPADSSAMKADYDKASGLLLKQRDINGAALAFKQHIVDYPSSPYVPNAYYWLGEIYLLQDQAELSRQSFTAVVEGHPLHAKAMDARFKLGKIYHQLGEDSRAKELLEIAATSTGGVSRKARAYLDNNF
ncbi:tetratricopeptide repeat protein [SAR92 clade bacterium H231]|jgi:tol-pal system protein YbgF|nr:tetratricopeptide repeat protein [SAR92 clade bacterium H231]MDG1446808.1 YbgF trimerization domain-containing protein [Porticoccaceae bacterium]